MLMIRLQRTGRKNEPTFRLVLTDKRKSVTSNDFVDLLGSYDPRDEKQDNLKADKIKEWIGKGAQPSDTVRNLLIETGIIEGKKVNVLPSKSPVVDEEAIKKAEEEAAAKAEAEKAAAEQAEAPAEEAAPAEEVPKEEEQTEEAPKEEEAPAEEEKKEE